MPSFLTTWIVGPSLAVALAFSTLAPAPAQAQELKQLALNDAQITSFIAAQVDFAPLVVKLSEAAERPDDSLKGELDTISKKHGFANFDDYMDINDNIAFVMGGINRNSMEFIEPVERLKRDLEEIKADKEIPEDEKKLAIEDLELEIKSAAPLKNRDNIEVVKRRFADLLKLLPDDGVEDPPEGAAAGPGAEAAPEKGPDAAPEKAP